MKKLKEIIKAGLKDMGNERIDKSKDKILREANEEASQSFETP